MTTAEKTLKWWNDYLEQNKTYPLIAEIEMQLNLAVDNEKQVKNIEVIPCCKSDSELLPDAEKEKLIEDAYWLNLQNLSGREDFEKAFRLGIETGVDETLEKLQG